jgi:Flp pilus assembly protein TadG
MKRKSLFSRLIRSSHGQSLIEFGMVLPFLLVVAFIITEFGRALWVQNVLTEAAGAGARAAIQATAATYQDKAEAAANRVLDANKMGTATGTVVTSTIYNEPNGEPGIWVKVSRDFQFIPGSGGQGSGLPTTPFAKPKDSIPLGTLTIAGDARMDVIQLFWN